MTSPPPQGAVRHSLPYMAGLDGLRALAVAAVVFYHLEVSWLPGGFLGVDMFFVVSGFLITSLLLADVRRMGRFDVRDFWLRRARRLLPGLTVVVVAVVLYVAAVHPAELMGLRGEVLAAGTYVTNWALILTDTSYFEAFSRPPLLRHLWSLAVEEQFYLLWPVAFAAGWALMRRRMLSVVWLGALASAIAMALLYEPLTDPSRVYFGTDTRAVGLLVGVGLAYITTPRQLAEARSGTALARQELAGWCGMIALTALMLFGNEFSPAMYRGGFLVASIATMMAIAGAAGPTRLARVLGVPVLVWLGRRSYGIYLWHWPVLMLTRPELDTTLSGGRLVALQLGATLALAALSYRWVERPIIEHGFGGWLRGMPRPRRRPTQAVTLACGIGVAVLFVVAVVTAPVPTEPALAATSESTVARVEPPHLALADRLDPEVDEPISIAHVDGRLVTRVAAATDGALRVHIATPGVPPTLAGPTVLALPDRLDGGTPATTGPPTDAVSPGDGSPGEGPATVAAPDRHRPPADDLTVTAVGDSVMLGAAEALAASLGPTAQIDGLVSRSFGDGVSVLAALAEEGQLGDVVVVHLGTNGPIDDGLVDSLMDATADADRVLAVTVRVPRRWEAQVNDTLAAATERWPRLELVDWKTASDDRPKLFVSDGVHLTEGGRKVYAELVAEAVASG